VLHTNNTGGSSGNMGGAVSSAYRTVSLLSIAGGMTFGHWQMNFNLTLGFMPSELPNANEFL